MPLPLSIYYHTDYDNDSLPAGQYDETKYGMPLTEDLLPELQDENYLFQGWYSTPTFDPESKVIVGSISDVFKLHLYAKWIPKNELNNKMTMLADEIRELSGSEEKMSLDNIIENLNGANSTIQNEANLIAQIIHAINNKSGYAKEKPETCLITFNILESYDGSQAYTSSFRYINSKYQEEVVDFYGFGSFTLEVLKGSLIQTNNIEIRPVEKEELSDWNFQTNYGPLFYEEELSVQENYYSLLVLKNGIYDFEFCN